MISTIQAPFPPAPPIASGDAQRLRIAVVTPRFSHHGGTERATSQLVASLSQSHDVCIFARTFDSTPGLCFHCIRVLPGPGVVRMLGFYSAASRSVRNAQSSSHPGFDLVYSPGPNASGVHVVSAHFCQARYRELLRHPGHAIPGSWSLAALRHLNRRLYSASISSLERRFYSSQSLLRVICPSRLLASDLTRYYGVDPARLSVAPLGVDTEIFNPSARLPLRAAARAALGISEERFAFLFIGNSWLLKGLRYAVEALPQVPEVTLLAVGHEDPHPLRRFAARLGVASRVIPLPPRSDVLFYYAAADALVAPSIYETFGLVPLEAMACGLPVILSRSMGVAEVVSPDEAVLLDSAEDVPAIAGAMNRIAADSLLRGQLAATGLCCARRNSWQVSCEATTQALLEVAAARRAAAQSSLA